MQNQTDALTAEIRMLEIENDQEFALLKEHVHLTYESLNPINLINSAFRVISSSEGKIKVLNITIGIATGYLVNKVVFGTSHNPIKKIFGTLLQFAIANVVSKHADGIISKSNNLLLRFLNHRKERKKESHNNCNED